MATVITAESEAKKIGDQDLNRLGSARITLGRLRKDEGSAWEKGSWKLVVSCKMGNAAQEFLGLPVKASPVISAKTFFCSSDATVPGPAGEPASIGGKRD